MVCSLPMVLAPERDEPALATDERATGAFVPVSGRGFDSEAISNCSAIPVGDNFVDIHLPWRTVAKEALKVRKNRFAAADGLAS